MRILIVGAGGHAKVVADAAKLAGMDIAGVIGAATTGATLAGAPVMPSAEHVDADGFIVAVGDNRARSKEFSEYLGRGLEPLSVVHPSATVARGARIGAGSFLAAGVIVNPDAQIGRNVILNTGCTVDHDCVLGDHVHIGPGTNLCGAVHVGTGTLMGVGSCAIPGVRIGEWATVGAGAAVTDEIPSRCVAVGMPAVARAVSAESDQT